MSYSKLGRNASHRWAMLRNMVTSLIKHERIETTVTRAKVLRRVADNMVTLSKRGTPTAKMLTRAVIREGEAVTKLWDVLRPRYETREGGYTRVVKTRRRFGDDAPMAFIEFIDRPGELRPARPPKVKMAKLEAEAKQNPIPPPPNA